MNASKAQLLEIIAKEIDRCAVCREGMSGFPVPGEGNPDADIVFIGEAPGRTEAETGRPFVGRSGKLLTRFIEEIGLKRDDVFITSPVKYYPGKRAPTPKEITHGREHLNKQLEVINPRVIVLLGGTAMKALFPNDVFAVSEQHGKVIERDGRSYFFTFHPAAVLRFPWKFEALMRSDFKKLQALFLS